MDVVRSLREMHERADADRAAGLRIALVPTMGALHAGHLSLVESGRRQADRVWVSIFVNPTQFDDPGDLLAYPRSFDADRAACEAAGVDGIFAPTAAEMYPDGAQTFVSVGALAEPLCGASRPGHFRGVATVVTKLLLAVKPHVAVFGQKDWQQLAVIRRMVRDLNLDVAVIGAPTQREPDGLAMSSRNARLDPEARRQATVLSRVLDEAARRVASGERDRDALLRRVRDEIGRAPLAEIDYAELRDPDTLAASPARLDGAALLALAVCFKSPAGGVADTVRLIDNRVLDVPGVPAQSEEDPR